MGRHAAKGQIMVTIQRPNFDLAIFEQHLTENVDMSPLAIAPYQQAMLELFEWQETLLLAVMAAGVPQNCIEVTQPQLTINRFLGDQITSEIHFVGRI